MGYLLELSQLGFSVIPIVSQKCSHGKPPKAALVPWKEWQHRKPSAQQLQQWENQFKQCNVAVVTGAISGVVVIDTDSEDADTALHALGVIPLTPKVKTAKGYHYYFQHPGHTIQSRTGLAGLPGLPNIDVRGDGGYVLAPPSLHPNGVHRYRWIYDPHDHPFQPIPEWLVEIVQPGADQQETPQVAQVKPAATLPTLTTSKREYHYVCKALENEMQNVMNAPEGRRNETLNKAAYSIGRYIGGGFIDQYTVYNGLFDAAISAGLDRGEIIPTLNSGLEAGISNPATLSLTHEAPAQQHGTQTTISQLIEKSRSAPVEDNMSRYSSAEQGGVSSLPTPPQQPPPPPITRRDDGQHSFSLDDIGNAQRLIALHGDKLLYNHTSGKEDGWLMWDGIRWKPCDKAEHRELAIDVTNAMAEDPSLSEPKDQTHIRASRGATRLRNMLWCAQSHPEIRVAQDELDADPLLLNCFSGTIDLARCDRSSSTFDPQTLLREHQQSDRITKTIRAYLDPEADYTLWIEFLLKIHGGKEDVVEFLQRAAGYSLTGLMKEQKLFFMIGSGKNGKTVFREALRFLWHDYAKETPFDSFIPRRQPGAPRPDLADLHGARLVLASEGPENTRLDEAMIKELTGGEALKTRRLNENFFTFSPQMKLWIATNHKPAISGNDDGIWRRILLISHNVQITSKEEDPFLLQKLNGFANGLFRWCLEGYWKYLREGLSPPASILLDTEEYRLEQDTIGAFLEEYTEVKVDGVTTKDAMYSAYKAYCEKSGERVRSKKWLGTRLKARMTKLGIEEDNRAGLGRVWTGIKLIDDKINVGTHLQNRML